jgi:hypothetical protein
MNPVSDRDRSRHDDMIMNNESYKKINKLYKLQIAICH